MSTELRNEKLLRQTQLDLTSLSGAYIFHDGTWWKVCDVGSSLLLQEATNLEAVEVLQHPGTRILLKQEPSITLTIQLLSKPEMSIEDAAEHVNIHFPHNHAHIAYDPLANQIYLKLEQDRLSYAQQDWLHLSTFAAVYIDSYEVQ